MTQRTRDLLVFWSMPALVVVAFVVAMLVGR
jgi:hypothetical protein